MGIFDNATSITIDGKTVEFITIDGEPVYEVEPSPSTRTLHFTVTKSGEAVQGAVVHLKDSSEEEKTATTGSAGGCSMSDVTDGEYSLYINMGGLSSNELILSINGDTPKTMYIVQITVDENTTSFDIELGISPT